MNDHGAADDFVKREPVGVKRHKGVALVAEQGRKIARVRRMQAVVGIIVHAGVCKGIFGVSGTGASLVYMESEYIRQTCSGALRESLHLCDQKHAAPRPIKGYRSFDIRIFRPAPYIGLRIRRSPENILKTAQA